MGLTEQKKLRSKVKYKQQNEKKKTNFNKIYLTSP